MNVAFVALAVVTTLTGYVTDDAPALANLNVVIAPAVEIPEIALSTEIVLTPIPITVVPAETTLAPADLETTSPN